MEITKIEEAAIRLALVSEAELQILDLPELQLALVGGGMGEIATG